MKNKPEDGPPINLFPSLQAVAEGAGLEPGKLGVGFVEGEPAHGREVIPVTDGKAAAPWTVSSIREMFRGNRVPPNLEHYPPEYVPYFYFIESHVLLLCDRIGDRTDQEMEEIFSLMRRRPDGRSLGRTHDFVWQIAAVLVGKYEVSEAQYEAIFGQIERSVRHFALRPVSRFYAGYLRSAFG